MGALRIAAALKLCLLCSACGTSVPGLRDWPDSTTERAEADMIVAVARSVGCELGATITHILSQDANLAERRASGSRYAEFLRNWGVQVALNLTVVERTGLNPTVLLTPPSGPSSVFTLAGAANLSAEATRLQKMNFFYTVEEFFKPDIFKRRARGEICRDPTGNKEGSLLVDSDLRLFSLLQGPLDASMLDFANHPSSSPKVVDAKNVLSQSISFKILTSASVTPTWRLVRAQFNQAGTFFGTGRDRTHELVITFGPLEKSSTGKGRTLIPIAQQTHLDTQLQTGIRSLLAP